MPDTRLADEPTAGHVIVCGANHLARRTVIELRRRGESVCLVAPEGTDLDELGVDGGVVVGDPRSDRTLRRAGAPGAVAVILAAEDDHGNLDAALAARSLNPVARIVIRLFDGELGSHLEELIPGARVLSSSALAAPGFVSAAVFGDAGERFTLGGRVLVMRGTGGAGIDLDGLTQPSGDDLVPIARFHPDRPVELLPEGLHGTEPGTLAMEVTDPTVRVLDELRRLAAPERRTVADRLRSLPAAFASRVTAPEQRLLKFATVLVALAVVSAAYFAWTAGLTPLDAISYAITLLTGASLLTDIDPATASAALKIYAIFLSLVGAALVAVVYAFITDAIIRSRLLQTLGRRSVPASITDHVVVCGLGTIGYRVALGVAELGVPVVVIEPDENGRFVAAARAVGIPVVIGDARQRELLASLGIDRARAIVAATSEDLVNLSAAFNARAIRPDLRVVLRLFDPDFAVRVQRAFGIRFTRSVSHLAAPAFAAAAIGSEVVATVPVGDRRLALFARLRVPAGSSLAGRRVAELHDPGRLRVLAVADPGSEAARWYPDPQTEILDPDEEVIVLATRDGLAGLLEQAQALRTGLPEASRGG